MDRNTHSAMMKTEFGIVSASQLPTVCIMLRKDGEEEEVLLETLLPGTQLTVNTVYKFVEALHSKTEGERNPVSSLLLTQTHRHTHWVKNIHTCTHSISHTK